MRAVMAATQVESFCERCGTKYTFDQRAERGRLLKGLGRTLGFLAEEGSLDDVPRGVARPVPRDVPLLPGVPAVHLPLLLERGSRLLPGLRAAGRTAPTWPTPRRSRPSKPRRTSAMP